MGALLDHNGTEERFRAIFGGRRGRPKYPMDRARGDDHDIFTRRVSMGWCDLYWHDTDQPERPFLWVIRDGRIVYSSTHKDWSNDTASQICSLGSVLVGTEHSSAKHGLEYSVYHESSRCSLRFSTRGHHLRLINPQGAVPRYWSPRGDGKREDGAKLAWEAITKILCAAQDS